MRSFSKPSSVQDLLRRAALMALPMTFVVSATASAQQILTAGDWDAGDQFGFSGQIDHGTAIVGAFRNDDIGTDSGAAYIFVKDPFGNWTQQAKLVSTDLASGDNFGYAVSLSGNSALVGAFRDDDGGDQTGSAYVFARDLSGNWAQQAKLTASDAVAGDQFGAAVSLYGNTAAIGAFRRDDVDPSSNSQSGAAYIFERTGSTWSETTRLNASNMEAGDQFGLSLSLHSDTLVVGAPRRDVVGAGLDAGAAYVYTRGTSGWTEEAYLTPSDSYGGDLFGWATGTDGQRVIVGAYRNDIGLETDHISDSYDSGAAYIFERVGNTWMEVERLVASDIENNMSFGGSVAILGDYAMVGANFQDASGDGTGSAYLFELGEDGTWDEIMKIEAADLGAGLDDGDQLANFVSIDGIDMLLGAFRWNPPGAEGTQHGGAWVVTVPEPGTASLAAIGCFVMLRRRRAAD